MTLEKMDALERAGWIRYEEKKRLPWQKYVEYHKRDEKGNHVCIQFLGWGWRKFRPWSWDKRDCNINFTSNEITEIAEVIKERGYSKEAGK